jgi:predicted nucleic acid-binding protein
LALENNIRHVCIDDLRGRRLEKAVGLEVIGVLGLLGKAKRRGLIPAIAPCIEKLVAAGAHYSPELVAAVIADVDRK